MGLVNIKHNEDRHQYLDLLCTLEQSQNKNGSYIVY